MPPSAANAWRTAFSGSSGRKVQASLHRWLPLPAGISTAGFVADALAHDVAVTSGEVFAVHAGYDPHGVRVCLCAEPDEKRLEGALGVLAGLVAADHSSALARGLAPAAHPDTSTRGRPMRAIADILSPRGDVLGRAAPGAKWRPARLLLPMPIPGGSLCSGTPVIRRMPDEGNSSVRRSCRVRWSGEG